MNVFYFFMGRAALYLVCYILYYSLILCIYCALGKSKKKISVYHSKFALQALVGRQMFSSVSVSVYFDFQSKLSIEICCRFKYNCYIVEIENVFNYYNCFLSPIFNDNIK